MNMSSTATDALAALSRHIGLPLEFADESCDFLIGGQNFTIRSDGARERLVVSALIADDLPDNPSRALVADLLGLGFGMMEEGLPAVGRDPETGLLAAFAFFPFAKLDAAGFSDAFDKFAAFATALADRLDRERHAPPSPPEEETETLPPGKFLQV